MKKAGSVTAPAQTLSSMSCGSCRKAPKCRSTSPRPPVDFGSGRSKFALPTLPASDFQTMAREAAPVKFEMEAAELRRLIDKTRFAISTEETRYYLNGIYLHHAKGAKGNVLRAVATDGHRLALAEGEAPKGADKLKGVIVPRKAVAEVRRLLDDAPEIITVEASDSKIVVPHRRGRADVQADRRVVPRLPARHPQGQHPHPHHRHQAFQGLRSTAWPPSRPSARARETVGVSRQADACGLRIRNPARRRGPRSETTTPKPLEIGFNAKYLLDVAGQIESEETRIEFNDAASPARVTRRQGRRRAVRADAAAGVGRGHARMSLGCNQRIYLVMCLR